MTASQVFIGALIIFAGLMYGLRWLLLTKGRRAVIFCRSIVRSIVHAVVTNSEVKQLVAKYPALFSFLQRRLDSRTFSGLPLTLLGLTFLYTLSLFFGLMENFVTSGQIVSIDMRLANLLYVFRNAHLIRLFLWITPLGKWQNILVFGAVASVVWWVRNRRTYIGPLWLGVGGSQLVALVGKLTLHRPRPTGLLPVYTEPSFSFPSGHAALAVAFYGFVLYYLLRTRLSWAKKINVLFFGLVVIAAVGFSRLYLGVHFLSDVLSGYLVGLLWLIVAISIVEWKKSRRRNSQPRSALPARARRVSYAAVPLTLAWYVGLTWLDIPPLMKIEAIPRPVAVVEKSALVDVFATNSLPKFTETLTGHAQEPLSFIILAADDEELVAAFAKAGWHTADSVTLNSLWTIVQAAYLQQSYPTAPMTPSFWNSAVHDFGLEKPTDMNLVSERHHARFWRTNLRTTDGRSVYVGTASYDVALKWFVTHRIQPDIDTERDRLMADLQAADVVADYHQQPLVPPTLGRNFTGDQFFTDGKTYVVEVAL